MVDAMAAATALAALMRKFNEPEADHQPSPAELGLLSDLLLNSVM